MCFINKQLFNLSNINEQLSFAQPEQVLQAVQLLCTDAYGSILWDLGSEKAEQFFKCWNTCVGGPQRIFPTGGPHLPLAPENSLHNKNGQ